jgi:hypothetical protein
VTVHAPTAHGELSALTAPDGLEVTANDIINYQKQLLAAQTAKINELQLSLNAVTNLCGCAMKFMTDKGYGDGDEPGKVSFSKFYLDSMKNCNMTISEDFAGGYTVRFQERAEGQLGRDG